MGNTPVADLTGVGVSAGIGVGPVRRVAATVPEPPAAPAVRSPAEELGAAMASLEAVATDLEERGRRAAGDAQAVLEAQAMMARDPGLADDIALRTEKGDAATRATYEAFAAYRTLLAAAGDYLAARVADLDDIRDRAVARLLGVPPPGVPQLDRPVVLVAVDLAPADTAVLDPALVKAFVTEQGGPTSHTAILARSLGVPAVVACPGATGIADGTTVLVDGSTGVVTVDPAPEQVAAAREAVEGEAAALGAPVHDLATTLILVVATRDEVAAVQVGDGATVVRDAAGALHALTTPNLGEYINQTVFVSAPDAVDAARVERWRGAATHVAAFTDGLQMLALVMPAGTPHAPFFHPVFRFASAAGDARRAEAQLEEFLAGPRVAARTDDDVTLLLGVRGE